MYIFSPKSGYEPPGSRSRRLNCDLSKKLGVANHIKEKKVLKIRALPKAAEPWMGDRNHPFNISQQQANSTIDATLNHQQTCSSHYSQLPPCPTTTSSLHSLNLQVF
jgi:hypothetical protein